MVCEIFCAELKIRHLKKKIPGLCRSLGEDVVLSVCSRSKGFATHSNVFVLTALSTTSTVDRAISAKSFPVNVRMAEARFLTFAAGNPYYVATGRDDKPLKPNSLTFAFKLNSDASLTGDLML